MQRPQELNNYAEFEQHVAKLFCKDGWKVVTPKANQPDYDLIVEKGDRIGAVQVKWLKSNVTTPQLLKFASFLEETEEGKKFNCGFFITTKGFARPACALIRGWGPESQIYCGVAREGGEGNNTIEWVLVPDPTPDKGGVKPKTKLYFGIFTCKGGVGKTTIAAHLAGALALQDFNVALVDLDPEQNLHKLVGDGVYVPKPKGMGPGNTITVFNAEDWHEEAARGCEIVICDCSPAVERNPKELVEKLDYCIIPTTLNPLGLNKHGKVIQDTVKAIRNINKEAYLFVLVNQFKKVAPRRMELLRKAFLNAYEETKKTDSKFHCIDPEEACIRASDQLYYWGLHLLENPDNPKSELAFELIGGKSHPREDFIVLSSYIESYIERKLSSNGLRANNVVSSLINESTYCASLV